MMYVHNTTITNKMAKKIKQKEKDFINLLKNKIEKESKKFPKLTYKKKLKWLWSVVKNVSTNNNNNNNTHSKLLIFTK